MPAIGSHASSVSACPDSSAQRSQNRRRSVTWPWRGELAAGKGDRKGRSGKRGEGGTAAAVVMARVYQCGWKVPARATPCRIGGAVPPLPD
ncbi:hypothetical protein Tamer19_35580 [Cupriavidus sp. TA19]|nr:hypothetical protein Tamer19_35580 [Cupriavidus sp. TA19]